VIVIVIVIVMVIVIVIVMFGRPCVAARGCGYGVFVLLRAGLGSCWICWERLGVYHACMCKPCGFSVVQQVIPLFTFSFA
jgi:hypothetical protein